MKIHCGNPDCTKTVHAASVRLKLPGTGKMHGEKWFCGRRCFRNYIADQLIVDHRRGLKQSVNRLKLGLLLVKNKLLTNEQLTAALELKSGTLKKLGQVLLEQGQITEAELKAALSMQAGVAPISLDDNTRLRLMEEIPFKLIDEFRFAVIDYDEETRSINAVVCEIDAIAPLQEFFNHVYFGHRVTFYLEEEKKLTRIIANNFPEEKLSVTVENRITPSVEDRRDSLEKTMVRIIEFFNGVCGNPVTIDNLDDAVWLKGESEDLKIDVYLSRKTPNKV